MTEETPKFTSIPPHIILISYIEGLKYEIKSLKGKIIHKLQDEMDKIGFFFTEHNIKAIIDSMVSQKNISWKKNLVRLRH